MAEHLNVSIVVPVLNEAPRLPGLLNRLGRDFPGCEVVVVDGGSTDGTADLVMPPARLVRCPPWTRTAAECRSRRSRR